MKEDGAKTALEGQKSLAAQVVEMLFDIQDVPERRRSKTVQEILGLSYHAAHRRMTGEAPWTLEDLQSVAEHYGRSLADLFEAWNESNGIHATFVAGAYRSPCRLWLGVASDRERPTSLVAWRDGDAWLVGPAFEREGLAQAVRRVLLEPKTIDRPRVAVLDDDAGYTKLFKTALMSLGFEVDAFTTPEPLLTAARSQPYDAYVVDWLLDEQLTAQELCKQLRLLDSGALLVLQSGQLTNNDVDEDVLLRTAMELDMEPVVKPVRPSFLAAMIERHIAKRGAKESLQLCRSMDPPN